MDEIIRLQSEICKTFSNPHRLHVIKLLCKKEMNATQLIEKTGLSKANLSQHMALLTTKGVVDSRKSGKNVFYRISDSKVSQACMLMQEVVVGSIKRRHNAIKK